MLFWEADIYFLKAILFIIYTDGELKVLERKIIKDIKKVFRLKKEIKGIKDIVFRNIKNLFGFKKEEKNYYKPVKVKNVWSNDYVEYKSNGDKKVLSVEEHLNVTRLYLKVIINNLKISDTWKSQLTVTFSFFNFEDDNDK